MASFLHGQKAKNYHRISIFGRRKYYKHRIVNTYGKPALDVNTIRQISRVTSNAREKVETNFSDRLGSVVCFYSLIFFIFSLQWIFKKYLQSVNYILMIYSNSYYSLCNANKL